MTEFEHQATNLIIRCEKTGDFLCNIYDNTYPIPEFRHKINLVGGARATSDISPLDCIQRELNEEFSLQTNSELDETLSKESAGAYTLPVVNAMAAQHEIGLFRESLVSELEPYADILIVFNPAIGPRLRFSKILISVFICVLSPDIFAIARRNIEMRLSMVSDGFLKIVSLDDLVNGSATGAWGTQKILEHYTRQPLPNPFQVFSRYLGEPRISYSAYMKDF